MEDIAHTSFVKSLCSSKRRPCCTLQWRGLVSIEETVEPSQKVADSLEELTGRQVALHLDVSNRTDPFPWIINTSAPFPFQRRWRGFCQISFEWSPQEFWSSCWRLGTLLRSMPCLCFAPQTRRQPQNGETLCYFFSQLLGHVQKTTDSLQKFIFTTGKILNI